MSPQPWSSAMTRTMFGGRPGSASTARGVQTSPNAIRTYILADMSVLKSAQFPFVIEWWMHADSITGQRNEIQGIALITFAGGSSGLLAQFAVHPENT